MERETFTFEMFEHAVDEFVECVQDGISCTWKMIRGEKEPNCVLLLCKFESEDKNIEKFHATFEVKSSRRGVKKSDRNGQLVIECIVTPIYKKKEDLRVTTNFYESYMTNCTLLVGGREMHVNKMFISLHSDFFFNLFSSDVQDCSLDEILIDGVNPDDFARLLSAVYPNPVLPTAETAPTLLKLAHQFKMRGVIKMLRPLMICNKTLEIGEKIALAERYELEELLEHCIGSLKTANDVKKLKNAPEYEKFSDSTKIKILDRILTVL
ncbi:unnamed protein product [Caenorhabditis sp. 36 PRJEB53466]|nr:unnamed protein product [Caenorhabditis sp. 36 PRJEB53466]